MIDDNFQDPLERHRQKKAMVIKEEMAGERDRMESDKMGEDQMERHHTEEDKTGESVRGEENPVNGIEGEGIKGGEEPPEAVIIV